MKQIKKISGIIFYLSFGIINAQEKNFKTDIIGDWKIYQISLPLGVTPNESHYKVWSFKETEIVIDGKRYVYSFENEFSLLIIKSQENEKKYVYSIKKLTKDTLHLKINFLPHEAMYLFLAKNNIFSHEKN